MDVSYLLTHLGAMAIVALALSYYLSKERSRREYAEEQLKNSIAEKASLESSVKEKTTAISDRDSRISRFETEMGKLNSQVTEKERRISELKTTIEKEREGFKEKLAILDEAKKKLGHEFQNLGNKIFEDTTAKFTDKNKTEMENLLTPLREQIKDFDKKVSDTHTKSSNDMASLKAHIENLKNLGEKMSQETLNLTTALKGESKTQGAWGEIILERALEMSGLVKGREYHVQQSYKGEEGKSLRPDVIVHLPGGKDVIIDSKASLTSYERYASCEDEEEKKEHLKQHILSVRNHVKELGARKYEEIPEITSLNYVLMFVPIESAFMLAVETERDLYKEAFDKNIIIVCPSTLLATLRTIQTIWQFEYQNLNAREIAESAGKMYDKFVTFIDHLEKVGKHIKQSEQAYETAFKSLCEGRGNLVKRASDLKEMGIKSAKDIPKNLSEKSQVSWYSISSGNGSDDAGKESIALEESGKIT